MHNFSHNFLYHLKNESLFNNCYPKKLLKIRRENSDNGGKDMRIAMLTNNYRPFVGGVPISVERQACKLAIDKIRASGNGVCTDVRGNTRRKRGSSGSRCFCSRAGCTLRNAET